jgi:hypothetical protein
VRERIWRPKGFAVPAGRGSSSDGLQWRAAEHQEAETASAREGGSTVLNRQLPACFATKGPTESRLWYSGELSKCACTGLPSWRTDGRTRCVAERRVRGLRVAEGNVPRGAAQGPGVTGPPRHAYDRVQRYDGGAARRARATSRGTFAFRCDRFSLGHFDHDLLPIFELKCTEQEIAKL